MKFKHVLTQVPIPFVNRICIYTRKEYMENEKQNLKILNLIHDLMFSHIRNYVKKLFFVNIRDLQSISLFF